MRNARNTVWTIIGMFIIGTLVLGGLVFVNQNQQDTGGFVPGIGGAPEDGLSISQIVRNPNDYIGTTVTLDGEVDRVVSPRVFILDQMGTIVGDEILVLSREPLSQETIDDINTAFQDADQVRVTGTVRNMTITEMERDLDLDFDPQVEVEFNNRPVIDATGVSRLSDSQ